MFQRTQKTVVTLPGNKSRTRQCPHGADTIATVSYAMVKLSKPGYNLFLILKLGQQENLFIRGRRCQNTQHEYNHQRKLTAWQGSFGQVHLLCSTRCHCALLYTHCCIKRHLNIVSSTDSEWCTSLQKNLTSRPRTRKIVKRLEREHSLRRTGSCCSTPWAAISPLCNRTGKRYGARPQIHNGIVGWYISVVTTER